MTNNELRRLVHIHIVPDLRDRVLESIGSRTLKQWWDTTSDPQSMKAVLYAIGNIDNDDPRIQKVRIEIGRPICDNLYELNTLKNPPQVVLNIRRQCAELFRKYITASDIERGYKKFMAEIGEIADARIREMKAEDEKAGG
jgi:hypothetical protein